MGLGGMGGGMGLQGMGGGMGMGMGMGMGILGSINLQDGPNNGSTNAPNGTSSTVRSNAGNTGGLGLGLMTTTAATDPDQAEIQRRTEEIIAFSARGMGSAAGAGEGGR